VNQIISPLVATGVKTLDFPPAFSWDGFFLLLFGEVVVAPFVGGGADGLIEYATFNSFPIFPFLEFRLCGLSFCLHFSLLVSIAEQGSFPGNT